MLQTILQRETNVLEFSQLCILFVVYFITEYSEIEAFNDQKATLNAGFNLGFCRVRF